MTSPRQPRDAAFCAVGCCSFKVRVAWHKLTGQRVAVKTYEKAKIKVRDVPFEARVHVKTCLSLEGVWGGGKSVRRVATWAQKSGC